MSMTPKHAEEARAERIARMQARRAEWATYETIDTTVDQIQVGDFIVKIPTQSRVRGMIFETAVTEVRPDHETWVLRGAAHPRRGTPVEGRWITTRHGTVSAPADFAVTVRRPQ